MAIVVDQPIINSPWVEPTAHYRSRSGVAERVETRRPSGYMPGLRSRGGQGTLLEEELGVGIRKLQSGPLGGDQQLGALIAQGEIDFLVFFWDPLEAQPHDPDVKALIRLAVVWNIPVACNRATADFLISSPLMTSDYERRLPNFTSYLDRFVSP